MIAMVGTEHSATSPKHTTRKPGIHEFDEADHFPNPADANQDAQSLLLAEILCMNPEVLNAERRPENEN